MQSSNSKNIGRRRASTQQVCVYSLRSLTSSAVISSCSHNTVGLINVLRTVLIHAARPYRACASQCCESRHSFHQLQFISFTILLLVVLCDPPNRRAYYGFHAVCHSVCPVYLSLTQEWNAIRSPKLMDWSFVLQEQI